MGRSSEKWTIQEGTDVVGSDGEKVGKVVAVQSDYVVVEKGFFFPSDYYIPTSAIANYDGDKAYLNVTRDQALDQGWDTEPTGAVATGTYADETAGTYTDDSAGTFAAGTTVDRNADVATNTRTAAAGDTINVPVQEEELTATRREVDRGSVRVEKDVVEEERTLDVPVTEERVTVNRRTVDRDATSDDTAFEGGTIDVPVRGEEVDVQKQARVTEEIEIGKEAVGRTEQVSDTVRREEIRVGESDVDQGGGRTEGALSDVDDAGRQSSRCGKKKGR